MYFRYYGLWKRRLDKCLKSPVWHDRSSSNMVNRHKPSRILYGRSFTIFIDQSEDNWVGKSLFVLYDILRLFVNTLTTNDKYYLLNRHNFTQPIQILLAQKQKNFSRLFSRLPKSALNFEHFQAKDDPHRGCISEIKDSQKCG